MRWGGFIRFGSVFGAFPPYFVNPLLQAVRFALFVRCFRVAPFVPVQFVVAIGTKSHKVCAVSIEAKAFHFAYCPCALDRYNMMNVNSRHILAVAQAKLAKRMRTQVVGTQNFPSLAV